MNKKLIGIAAIVILFIVATIFYTGNPASFQVVPESCEQTNIGIACSSDQDCINYFANQGAPANWINSQEFNCISFSCYVTPNENECQSTFVEVN
jgi:hypothetical protein